LRWPDILSPLQANTKAFIRPRTDSSTPGHSKSLGTFPSCSEQV